MNVTSLDVSKRLYANSEWQDHQGRWVWAKVGPLDKAELTKTGIPVWTWWPAYELGYLVRQLNDGGRPVLLSNAPNRQWRAYTSLGEQLPRECLANTPEDAMALLALKLFDEGVLHVKG